MPRRMRRLASFAAGAAVGASRKCTRAWRMSGQSTMAAGMAPGRLERRRSSTVRAASSSSAEFEKPAARVARSCWFWWEALRRSSMITGKPLWRNMASAQAGWLLRLTTQWRTRPRMGLLAGREASRCRKLAEAWLTVPISSGRSPSFAAGSASPPPAGVSAPASSSLPSPLTRSAARTMRALETDSSSMRVLGREEGSLEEAALTEGRTMSESRWKTFLRSPAAWSWAMILWGTVSDSAQTEARIWRARVWILPASLLEAASIFTTPWRRVWKSALSGSLSRSRWRFVWKRRDERQVEADSRRGASSMRYTRPPAVAISVAAVELRLQMEMRLAQAPSATWSWVVGSPAPSRWARMPRNAVASRAMIAGMFWLSWSPVQMALSAPVLATATWKRSLTAMARTFSSTEDRSMAYWVATSGFRFTVTLIVACFSPRSQAVVSRMVMCSGDRGGAGGAVARGTSRRVSCSRAWSAPPGPQSTMAERTCLCRARARRVSTAAPTTSTPPFPGCSRSRSRPVLIRFARGNTSPAATRRWAWSATAPATFRRVSRTSETRWRESTPGSWRCFSTMRSSMRAGAPRVAMAFQHCSWVLVVLSTLTARRVTARSLSSMRMRDTASTPARSSLEGSAPTVMAAKDARAEYMVRRSVWERRVTLAPRAPARLSSRAASGVAQRASMRRKPAFAHSPPAWPPPRMIST
mmetsp:Transcript_31234/g.90792  ORF Transcript_31234/g.90792 Transcript_31234/m.90792 type:complete len:698 (-) Transcript_31234:2356-4449(-)